MTEAELRTVKDVITRRFGAKEWHTLENKNGVMVYSD